MALKVVPILHWFLILISNHCLFQLVQNWQCSQYLDLEYAETAETYSLSTAQLLVLTQGPFALDDNDVFLVVFFLSSGVNSSIGNHATHFKSCADDIKSLCRRRQVRTGPQTHQIYINIMEKFILKNYMSHSEISPHLPPPQIEAQRCQKKFTCMYIANVYLRKKNSVVLWSTFWCRFMLQVQLRMKKFPTLTRIYYFGEAIVIMVELKTIVYEEIQMIQLTLN